ncbi:hypothetical protein C8J57DRAFT_1215940 [Mycena rebaudengoi]|nr:hypothetical protein C8J57DRAFT_1215940 [Mycena rebaudengoi]
MHPGIFLDSTPQAPADTLDLLSHQIKRFDPATLRRSNQLDEAAAQAIPELTGATLAAALWIASVGDSTVDGTRDGTKLSKRQNSMVPSEYARISARHPTTERQDLFMDDRLLGSMNLTRDTTFSPGFPEKLRKFNKTPPYLTATPRTSFKRGLNQFGFSRSRKARPSPAFLFTDGVDNIVNREPD